MICKGGRARTATKIHGNVFRVLLRSDYWQPPVYDLGIRKRLYKIKISIPSFRQSIDAFNQGMLTTSKNKTSTKAKLQTNTSVQRRVLRPVLISTAPNM